MQLVLFTMIKCYDILYFTRITRIALRGSNEDRSEKGLSFHFRGKCIYTFPFSREFWDNSCYLNAMACTVLLYIVVVYFTRYLEKRIGGSLIQFKSPWSEFTSILKNVLCFMLQIVLYQEAFECNTTSGWLTIRFSQVWFSQSEVVLHSKMQILEKKTKIILENGWRIHQSFAETFFMNKHSNSYHNTLKRTLRRLESTSGPPLRIFVSKSLLGGTCLGQNRVLVV